MKDRKIKSVGFVGFGRSSAGVFEYLKASGDFTYTVRCPEKTEKIGGISRYFHGDAYLSGIDEDILFISPAVKRTRPELMLAEAGGVILSSDAELFFEKNRGTVYAVTGSSGKSTVTALISSMLSECGIYAPIAGNFGGGLSPYIGCDTVAAELSSFQLMYMKPRTKRAVITNITKNHLDWHTDMEEYTRAKLNIVNGSEGVVCDFDSGLCEDTVGKIPFAVISTAHAYGELSKITRAENYLTLISDTVYLNGKPYISLAAAPRREAYNIRNYMLSAAATLGVCDADACQRAIMGFFGLANRAELIAEHEGIRFINSSIDTSAERTEKTLSSLAQNTVVILCGKNKGLDLSGLAAALPALTVGAVLMGDIGDEISRFLPCGYKYRFEGDFYSAVTAAADMLGGSGSIILSPAGTSFDKYRNYEQRGDAFRSAVTKYINDKGCKK